jgi:hypothetical protein
LQTSLSKIINEIQHSRAISRNQLIAIAKEKNGGKLSKTKTLAALERNSELAVLSLTEAAFASDDPEVQIRTLLGLDGVRVPTASCILAWREPQRFAVIDKRAVAAIEHLTGARIAPNRVFDWLMYLVAVREVAKELEQSCMEVDRRLYTLGKSLEREPGRQ